MQHLELYQFIVIVWRSHLKGKNLSLPFFLWSSSPFFLWSSSHHNHHLPYHALCRVHWAGTETATVWTGFMNGAVQAGTRATNEILQKLYPDFVSPAQDNDDDASRKSNARNAKGISWTVGIISILVLIVGVVIMAMYCF